MNAQRFSLLFFFLLFLVDSTTTLKAQINRDTINKYYNSIVYPSDETTISKGISFYTRKKEKDQDSRDTLSTINDLRLIALGQFNIGNIYDSESSVAEAISLIDHYSKKDTLIEGRKGLYNQLGNIYRETKKYDKALEAYNLSLSFSTKLSDSITLINNKANIYKDWGRFQKASEQFNFAFQKMGNDTNSLRSAMILDNLGFVQSKLKNPNAILNLKKAQTIRENFKNVEGAYSSNKHLSLYYLDRNDTIKAMKYAKKAYEIANSLNSITFLQDALSLYVIMNEDQKIVEFKYITDSIANAKQLAENKNAFIKYNVEKERKNTMAAQLLQEKEKAQKRLFMILGISIFILAALIILLLKARHKKEKIIQVHKTEARISKKVHDDVANDIYQLMAKMQGKYKEEEAMLDDLENIYNKTRDISKENSAIEIGADFSEQLNDLLLTYQSDTTAISTRNLATLDWEIIPKIKKETVYKVLRELMTNMKKYSNASAVLLTFHQSGKNITIEYTDNGQGCTLKNKNGLQNAENRIQAIKGTITFESEPGNGFRSKIII
ncbi:ATP-binding protein [Aequorivita sp. SDUM287046]|uniref:histidine kinase n=1 Tax=Aequorivita aurantiaca TaxID=3053356 RepID=A0ABT8DKP6_9FLAO|nr:tetratricopeptide repeat-containing sensor histidine kinase [Aequorivita aurantiaca]MDN3725414.1 ATP-binding protein [Aequorivita aurantiaca]